MYLLHTLFLLSQAWGSGPVFTAASAEMTMGEGGTWARLFPSDTGWTWFSASGGDYWATPLPADFTSIPFDGRVQLTRSGLLQDVQVERCADGSWLLAGSWEEPDFGPLAGSWRLDSKLNVEEEFELDPGAEGQANNDMLVVCDPKRAGAAFGGEASGEASYFPVSGADAGTALAIPLNAMGAGAATRARDGKLVAVDVLGPGSPYLRIKVFGEDFTVESESHVEVATDSRAFWPQRIQEVGTGWLVTYLVREQGGPDGEVVVAALDADFALIDQLVLSPPGTENGRPWFAVERDRMLVTYDRDVQPRLVEVTLSLEALGVVDRPHEPDEEAAPDSVSGGSVDPTVPLAFDAWGASTDDDTLTAYRASQMGLELEPQASCATAAPRAGLAALVGALLALRQRRAR